MENATPIGETSNVEKNRTHVYREVPSPFSSPEGPGSLASEVTRPNVKAPLLRPISSLEARKNYVIHPDLHAFEETVVIAKEGTVYRNKDLEEVKVVRSHL